MTSLYLASGSPRRQELLAQLGVTFERIVTGIEEQRQPQESAQQYVVRLAREKAQAGVAQTAQDLPVLGADTIVILNGEVLEKPRDAEHAAQMLRKLSGQSSESRFSTVTVAPKITRPLLGILVTSITCAFDSLASMSLIRPSQKPCCSRAAWYSAFSFRSPCSRASVLHR